MILKKEFTEDKRLLVQILVSAMAFMNIWDIPNLKLGRAIVSPVHGLDPHVSPERPEVVLCSAQDSHQGT